MVLLMQSLVMLCATSRQCPSTQRTHWSLF
jgi:hypothetical protein